MAMKAGKLRHEVTIQSNSKANDSYGQAISSWSDLASTYAHIENLRGSELFQAQSVESRINTKITIRWVDGVRSNMRVQNTYSGETHNYNIVYVNRINEIEETIELLCERLEDIANG